MLEALDWVDSRNVTMAQNRVYKQDAIMMLCPIKTVKVKKLLIDETRRAFAFMNSRRVKKKKTDYFIKPNDSELGFKVSIDVHCTDMCKSLINYILPAQ